jgi:hypothetical protein
MAVFARARIVVCEPRCEILGTSERFFFQHAEAENDSRKLRPVI